MLHIIRVRLYEISRIDKSIETEEIRGYLGEAGGKDGKQLLDT